MTGFGVEEDVRVDVDLDATVPCRGMWDEDCLNEPAWRGVKVCCGFSALWCTPCKEGISSWYADGPALFLATYCRECLELDFDFVPPRFYPV